MTLIIILVLGVLALTLFIGSAVFLWITKLFKLENPTYKKSLVILVLYTILASAVSIVPILLNTGGIFSLLLVVVTFFLFHLILKKYYQNSWAKSLGVYIAFGIALGFVELIIILPIRYYVAQPFVATGQSMSPTYNNGDYLFVNELTNNFQREDIVVFRYPLDQSQFFIKRIVGLPGETVTIQNGQVFINNQKLVENYAVGDTLGDGTVVVPSGQYFLLGDNRMMSSDSRKFGPVTRSLIVGKIFTKINFLSRPQ